MRFDQAKEDLATDFASTLLKGAYFRALKELTFRKKQDKNIEEYQEQQADKLYQVNILHELHRYTQNNNSKRYVLKRMMRRWVNKDLSKGFNAWRKEIRDKKSLDKLYNYFGILESNNTNTVKQKLFYAWKSFRLQNKYQAAAGELAVERPRRQELEQNLSFTQNEGVRNSQIKVGRVLAKRFVSQVSSYFVIWKQNSAHYKQSLPRVKKMLVFQYMAKIRESFKAWKRQVVNQDIIALCRKNEETMIENQTLAEHLNNLELVLQQAEAQKVDIISKRMKNVLVSIQNKELSAALRTWARHALTASNIESASDRLERKLKNLLYYKALNAILAESIAHKKREAREKRLAHYMMVNWRNSLISTFESWKDYSRILASFRRQLKKSQNRANQLNMHFSLSKWRNKIVTKNQVEAANAQKDLLKKNALLNKNLEDKTKEHEEQVKYSQKLDKNLRQKSKKRITLALIKCSQGSRKIYWDRWRASIALQDSKVEESSKLIRL